MISYLRKSTHSTLLIVHNFTPNTHLDYQITVPWVGVIKEVFNSDREEYFGSGRINTHVRRQGASLEFTLAPLATMIFKVECGD